MKPKNVLIVYMQKNNKTLAEVKRVLTQQKITFKAINRVDLKQIKPVYDLVITIGGDGTFLKTSHHLFCKVPILGVNADPDKKEGFFTRASKTTFEHIIKRTLIIKKLQRLEVAINDKPIKDYPLNEVFIGHYKPYQMSALEIDKHPTRCSGILVATPAGSYGWAKSAGGEELPLFSEEFEYVLMDPYQRNVYKVKHPQKKLKKNQKVTIKPLMNGCIAVIDSLSQEYHLKKGDVVTVKRSKHPLYFVDDHE